MATQTVRLKKAWGLHPQGAVITTDVPVTMELIRSGRAELIEEQQTVDVDHIEPAVPVSPTVTVRAQKKIK